MGSVRKLLFGKYLIITNTVSCGIMMGIGDVIQQRREYWRQRNFSSSNKLDNVVNHQFTLNIQQCTSNILMDNKKNEGIITLANTFNADGNCHDVVRTRNMTAIGFIQGPFHHYFYLLLDRFLPGRSIISVVKKTFVDQMIGSPTCLAIFFFGHEMLEQRDPREVYTKILDKLFQTYKVDCCFWPPTQLINFFFVSIQYRVVYINIMNVFYNIFLSYTKYQDEQCISN